MIQFTLVEILSGPSWQTHRTPASNDLSVPEILDLGRAVAEVREDVVVVLGASIEMDQTSLQLPRLRAPQHLLHLRKGIAKRLVS